MNYPQLVIKQTPAVLGIERERGYFDLKINQPAIKIDYNQPKPYQQVGAMAISAPPAKMEIEQGYRKLQDLAVFLKERSRQRTVEGLATIVGEGDYLAQVEKGGNRIADLARTKLAGPEGPVINLMPEEPPEINVTTGSVQVDYPMTWIKVTSNFQFPRAEVKTDRLRVFLAQKANLEIEVIGGELDLRA